MSQKKHKLLASEYYFKDTFFFFDGRFAELVSTGVDSLSIFWASSMARF